MPYYYKTPRSILLWHTLEQWIECAWQIEHRRCNKHKNDLKRLHVEALPVSFDKQLRMQRYAPSLQFIIELRAERLCTTTSRT